MSGLDTDPKMMRGQQDKDAPETIEANEAEAKAGRSDLDPVSRQDREAAKTPEGEGRAAQDANETMDDVFEGNRAATGSTGDAMAQDAATDGAASLAQRGRSLLGR